MRMLPVAISMAATYAHATLGGQEMESTALVREDLSTFWMQLS